MTRMVFCRKHQQQLEGLERAPFPGPKGLDIFENISANAWQAWMSEQTMLINEKHLNLMDPNTKPYLDSQREHFFNNEEYDKAEGYTPKDSKK